MSNLRCPGQDQRNWTPDALFDVKCPKCGGEFEIWKDEPFLPCPDCGREVRNPRLDLGCAKWCAYAEQCLGTRPGGDAIADPVLETLKTKLEQRLPQPERVQALTQALVQAASLEAFECENARAAMISALIILVRRTQPESWEKWREALTELDLPTKETGDIAKTVKTILKGEILDTDTCQSTVKLLGSVGTIMNKKENA